MARRQSAKGADPVAVNTVAYDELAAEYTHRTDSIDIAYPFYDFASALPRRRILDVGCGSGRDVETMLENGYRAVGVDISGKMLDIARKRIREFVTSKPDSASFLAKLGDGSESLDSIIGSMFHQVSMQDLPIGRPGFEPDSYGGVWAVTSIQHVPRGKLPDFLLKAHALLAPHGLLYIKTRAPLPGQPSDLVECLETSDENGKEFTRFFTYHSPQEVVKRLKETSFKVIRTSQNNEEGRIEYPAINSGEPGYKFWLIAEKA